MRTTSPPSQLPGLPQNGLGPAIVEAGVEREADCRRSASR